MTGKKTPQTTCDGCPTGTRPPEGWNLLELHLSTTRPGAPPTTWQLCAACARATKKLLSLTGKKKT